MNPGDPNIELVSARRDVSEWQWRSRVELAEEYPDFMSKPRRPQTTFLKATSIQLNTNPGGNAYKFVMNKIRMRVSP